MPKCGDRLLPATVMFNLYVKFAQQYALGENAAAQYLDQITLQ